MQFRITLYSQTSSRIKIAFLCDQIKGFTVTNVKAIDFIFKLKTFSVYKIVPNSLAIIFYELTSLLFKQNK